VLSSDDTLPPTPIDDLVAVAGLQVYALATDTTVREAVRRACGARYRLTVVDDWGSLIAAIDERHCDIAVIEASVLGVRLDKCITELGRGARQVVTLVATDRKEAQSLIGFFPVYPADAQIRQIEGWVEVGYIVDRAGLPRELRVLQATPPGRFDQAALTAVAKYRYEPFTRDGQVYERRVWLRLRFSLK